MKNFSRSWKHDQVFISFRELKRSKINFFIDEDETRGRQITTLFETIRESGVALILLSNKHSDSEWCLDELVEIKNQMETGSDPVFFTDVVTKVKELFEFKAIPKKSSSYIITNQVIEEKPIMHQQKTSPAIPTVKSLDDDLFYSLPSFLQALDLEITDLEGFTEMHNGLISLSLKRHTNLVCLNLGSLEKLVHFRC
uniref:TIR domain-containing protein n=1 Tax=Brassica oleracea var. oleracea TaxID=109376 RepID=A0A0D2ZS34_BRAOL